MGTCKKFEGVVGWGVLIWERGCLLLRQSHNKRTAVVAERSIKRLLPGGLVVCLTLAVADVLLLSGVV